MTLPLQEPQWPDIVRQIRALPATPRSLHGPENWLNGLRLFADYLVTVPPAMARWTAPIRRYSKDFRRVTFPSRDGTRLSGWLGVAPANGNGAVGIAEPRDGLILLPGLYTSKDNYRIRARSEKILREWGFHVLTLDLRGVGGSERTYSTPGWKEAQDIQAAVAYLRTNARVRRVHLYAESLAASAALIAAGQAGRSGAKLLDGRLVAMSAYADARTIVDLYATPHPERTPLGKDFVMVQKFFNGLLRLQGYRGGRFDHYIRDGANHYGATLDETFYQSSPRNFVSSIGVPTLIIHSHDDGLVPISEAQELQRRATGNPNVEVLFLPWGYHCLYEMADPDWYWRVLGTVFGVPTEPGRAAPVPPVAAASPRNARGTSRS